LKLSNAAVCLAVIGKVPSCRTIRFVYKIEEDATHLLGYSQLIFRALSGCKINATGYEERNPMSEKGKCTGWKAWHDREPGGPATLHVKGTCEFSTSGYKVELKPAKFQGINPKIYILEKIVHSPAGGSSDVKSHVDVEYTEKTSTHYESVTITPDGVTIPVKEVS
jgi:hypothetical protein